ncbi:MAG: cache domain-containing protein [Clostridia bacterium]|nr:cache domain-containing protein [Clostridia bacterium]
MQMWRPLLILGVAFVIFFGFVMIDQEQNEETCETRTAIEATASSFHRAMSTLDQTVSEGADKLSALRDTDVREHVLETINQSAYFFDATGVYQNIFDPEKSTGFATGYVPIDEDVQKNLMATESLEPYFKNILKKYALVKQVYYNDLQSFSRLYPGVDIRGLVVPNVNLADYNFMSNAYENMEKTRFISTPYIDPAGNGWVVSMIRPVVFEGELIGVFGVDLSVNVLEDMLITINGTLVVNEDGYVVTLSEDMYQQAGIKVLNEHKYYYGVDNTILLPDDYNLSNSKIKGFREMWQQINEEHVYRGMISFDGKERRYCAVPVEDYGLYLIHINTE